ncbi:hypothetical protein PN498_18230 [Oscillatoria sp. CS-180]|uniref:hypothetical protein n=1 Tax=Oscillatoria sp. CS-180 TaxID=3021720 RepID=UPI00232CF7AC|nr:hypothetical protein [Oscillatoria sp. CS-180]MDB9527937.1 hypothetical protein [Oscillatoria sp. CS-180]
MPDISAAQLQPSAGQPNIPYRPACSQMQARSRSFIDPHTGNLYAPGLGNTMDGVRYDQLRRTDEVLEQIR